MRNALSQNLEQFARLALDHGFPQSSLDYEWALGQLGSLSAEQETLVRQTIAYWNRVIVHLLKEETSPAALCGYQTSVLQEPPILDGRHIFFKPSPLRNQSEYVWNSRRERDQL
jgi:hypothetical protein